MTIDSASAGRLTHLGVLRFSGPDSLSFLQGQLSNDTQRLAGNTSLLAAYSSAQGRVLALIYLLPHSSGVLGILPREILPATMERMRKFVMRAKVKIEDAGDSLAVGGRFTVSSSSGAMPSSGTVPSSRAILPSGGYTETDGMGVAPVARDANRHWLIAAPQAFASVDASEAQRVENEWRLADIRAGLPQIYAATSEAFVAQMLNLDLLDAISFTKGCYTGQEIIARTQHLGRIKRRLYRLSLPPGAWSIGQALRLSDGRQGRLTEVIDSGGGIEALAVLTVEPGPTADLDPGTAEIAVPATELPLPYAPA